MTKNHELSQLIKSTYFFLIILLFGASHALAQQIGSVLQTESKVVEVGQVITVDLSMNPNNNYRVFTVSANLVYDPTKLELVSAETYPEWIELKQKENYITDTINGFVLRTGGYPTGFVKSTKFVRYQFKALAEGDTGLQINAGRSLNDDNLDLGVRKTLINLSVESGEGVGASETKTLAIDANLDIDSDSAFYRQNPYSFSVFHKKEELAQQAITKVWLFDEDWNVHFEDQKLWQTTQDTVLDFTIPADTVYEEGNYTIIAKVRYENDLESEVFEKKIGILSNGQTWFTKNSKEFLPIFFLVVFIAFTHHLMMEREAYFKIQNMLNRPKKFKKTRIGKSVKK